MFKLIIAVLLSSAISNSNQKECLPALNDCSRDKVSFFLYTGPNEQPQELILDNPASFNNAIFNENISFKFIVHGFMQSKDNPMMVKLRDEYFKSNQWNLIYLDWHSVTTDKCYNETAVPSSPKIGECAASLIRQLFDQRPDVTIDQFHFIGFSLGAQICAQISINLEPLRIPRITGCDPALTGSFWGTPDSVNANTLNRQHANFVDSIHTNMGGIGVSFSFAHYDMYANDGVIQSGCNEARDPDVCSHTRALEIFIESINSPRKFIAVKCDDKDAWISKKKCTGDHQLKKEVGERCTPPQNENVMGIYHFYTNPREPLGIASASFVPEKWIFDRILAYFKSLISYFF